MYSKICICTFWLILFGSVVFGNPLASESEEIDYCTIGLSDSLDGRAYEIIEHSLSKTIAAQLSYSSFLKSFKVMYGFRIAFGDIGSNVLDNIEWYYMFNTSRNANVSNILKESLPCIYITDRDIPNTEKYLSNLFDLENVVSYILYDVLDHLKDEVPSNAPIPIISYSNDSTQKIICNFGKAPYNGDEYYVAVCFHPTNVGSNNIETWVRIVQKSSSRAFSLL